MVTDFDFRHQDHLLPAQWLYIIDLREDYMPHPLYVSSLFGLFGCPSAKGDHKHNSSKEQNAEEANRAVKQDSGCRHIQGVGEESNHRQHAAFDQSNAAAGKGYDRQQGLTEGDEEGG